jgi:TPR repeat protein
MKALVRKAFLLAALLTANMLFASDPKLKDYPEAQELEQKAESGDKFSIYKLGEFYDAELNDEKKAVYWFTKYYGKIDKASAYDIAIDYIGEGRRDKARAWFLKSYKMGNAEAAYMLGMMLLPDTEGYEEEDKPVISDEDCKLAVKYLKEAHRLGYKYAIYDLAKLSDTKEAIEWFKIGYKEGLPDAASQIANRYIELEDYQNAIKWLETHYKNELSAGNKSWAIKTAYEIGNVYDSSEDYQSAIKWLKIAYDNGHGAAAFALGMVYKNKLKDYPNAIKWYKIDNSEYGRENLDALNKKLSQEAPADINSTAKP